MATIGGRISLPLAVGVDRGHPQWPDQIFFLLKKLSELAMDDGIYLLEVGDGWRRLGN